MNGLSWPAGLFALSVAVLSISDPADFPAIPVIGTLTVLWGLMKFVERAKLMTDSLKKECREGLVSHSDLEIALLKFKEELRREFAAQRKGA